jgi:presenilin-like A22 family membrane protease
MILSFLLGCVIGSAVVGSSVKRTLGVHNGDISTVLTNSLINSAAYYISITWIAKADIVAYAGTVVGSTLLVCYMAAKNKEAQNGQDS